MRVVTPPRGSLSTYLPKSIAIATRQVDNTEQTYFFVEDCMLIGQGAYTYSEAASFTRLRTARVREWFVARPSTTLGAVFQSDYDGKTTQPLISFLDLVDVYIAGQLRDRGVSLQTLRKVYGALQLEFEAEHPFGRRELLTDGKSVFLAGLDSQGRDEVIEVLTRQRAFPKVIRPFLQTLEFDTESRLASKWNIAKGVVLNPGICFGQPIVEAKGIPTHIIAKAVQANKNNRKAVADWYGMTVKDVAAAVRFEAQRAA